MHVISREILHNIETPAFIISEILTSHQEVGFQCLDNFSSNIGTQMERQSHLKGKFYAYPIDLNEKSISLIHTIFNSSQVDPKRLFRKYSQHSCQFVKRSV